MGDTAQGAAAGAVGVLAMDVVTWWMYRRESPRDQDREHAARAFGMDTAHAAVRKFARTVGSPAGREQPNGAGIAVHYGLGMVPAALYVRLRRRYPWLRAGGGALYGFVLFVINDEIAAPLIGVAGGPGKYPWQAHLRGLVGHVVLGMVTDAMLNAIEDWSYPDAFPYAGAEPSGS